MALGSLKRMALKNILFLTDFSKPSEAALPVAMAVAREYEAKLYVLHVLQPDPFMAMTPEMLVDFGRAQEQAARIRIIQLHKKLEGTENEVVLLEDSSVWRAIVGFLSRQPIDLIVMGTHGRTGTAKYLLGSVTEEIFRRSPVPVMTVGPRFHPPEENGARFQRVLFATDFNGGSLAAAAYAVSFAQENQAHLILLHVIPREAPDDLARQRLSIAEAMHKLDDIVPLEAQLWCKPECVVEYGEPARRILEVATREDADLIVLSLRDASHLLARRICRRAWPTKWLPTRRARGTDSSPPRWPCPVSL